jgi:F-type H+-transporting ATPase subunit epsilon
VRLRVLLPGSVLVDEEVSAVCGEGPAGAFGLLPRHIDMATALVPGLISYRTRDGDERYVATGEAVLVKRGFEVTVSTRQAVRGKELGSLRQGIEDEFARLDDHERRVRSALASLEFDLVRRISELGRQR